jgi:hypothetical protein
MYLKLISSARSAMALALISALDAEVGPCTISFYTGAYPALVSTAVTTQTLLGTLTCSDPVATDNGSGVITFATITQDSAADASGTAAWARIRAGAGGAIMDVDVSSVAAGTGVIQLNTTNIVAGGPIAMTGFTITMGG